MPELNKAQKQAVEHESGPLLVIAGAGTGKTRVIVERIVRLIDSGVKPESILALTFTEKAANEMQDRVNEARGAFTLDAEIRTYNGFGGQLLRQYSTDIGLASNATLLGETGQLVFLRQHLDQLDLDYYAPVSKPDSQLEAIAKYISKLKQHLVTPDKYLEFTKKMSSTTEEEKLEKQRHQELAGAYQKYIELSRKKSVIDYDDQIYLLVELLEKRPNIRKQIQDRFEYILVDEYQDTNPMQSKLLDLMCNKNQNLMVVGDDDQSIYGWRGATLKNIMQFKDRYPKYKEITLIKNYRSSQNILDSAYRLIQNNNPDRLEAMLKLDKRLVADIGKGKDPQIVHFASLKAELAWLAKDITEKIANGVEPAKIAVLARRNTTIGLIHETLDYSGIEHTVAGLTSDIYKQLITINMIETLKAVVDPHDDVALFHSMGSVLFDVKPNLLAKAMSQAKLNHQRLVEVLQEEDDKDVTKALELLESWRELQHSVSVSQLALAVLTDSGLKQQLYDKIETDHQAGFEVQVLGQFFETLNEFERVTDVPSTLSYLNNVETLKAGGSEIEDNSLHISDRTVNVLSVHKAKGLEWQVVYIFDCSEGSFPLRKHGAVIDLPEGLIEKTLADEHMSEERRLMYVATTRAEENLIISYSDTHTGNTKRLASRFIEELTGENAKENDQTEATDEINLDQHIEDVNKIHEVSLPSRFIAGNKIVLSVSQIDRFLTCPQDFYYRYVLNAPEPLNPVLEYGTIIHGVIQKIYLGIKDKSLPTLETILDNIVWPQAGYMSATHREKAHKQGVATIKKMYAKLPEEIQPDKVEEGFRVEIEESDLIMSGRIDAVFIENDVVEIRDFKTGTSVRTAEKAKSKAQSSVQLGLYALAWQTMYGDTPAKLSLGYVETNQIGSVAKRAKTIDNLRLKISKIPALIKNGTYKPGKDHTYCQHPK